jgi:hypothetical protein
MPYKDPEAARANARLRSARYAAKNREKLRAKVKDPVKHRAQQIAYKAAHPEKVKDSVKAWSKRNAHYKRRTALAGRPRPEFCEVCGRPPKDGRILVFDHCHTKGHFRGWLCHGCNTVLGMVDDDPEICLRLAAYLRRTKDGSSTQLTLPI